MSISAAASVMSWLTGNNPVSAANGTQTAAANFPAKLLQWQNSTAAGSQTASVTQGQPDQGGSEAVEHHHHHHRHETGPDSSQPGGGTIQSALSSLAADIAGALQTGGAASGAVGTTGNTADASIQSATNTLVADLAQATQIATGANATTPAPGSTAAAASAAGTNASVQAVANTLATDIAQALQAYGATTSATANTLVLV